jgi:hypothetical protein
LNNTASLEQSNMLNRSPSQYEKLDSKTEDVQMTKSVQEVMLKSLNLNNGISEMEKKLIEKYH